MSAAARAMVKGACPGALRPMESGDGLIVRVRPRAGTLSVAAAGTLARAAARFGNGHIDLTRRANLQIRGVTSATLPALQRAIDDLGLLDATAEAEAVRNIVVSPLAGVDPEEVLDVRAIALELERLIAADARLWRLPAKFGFVVDGGGALGLGSERADIRLEAVSRDSVAIGIDRAQRTAWLGTVIADKAAIAAARVAAAFVEVRPAGSRMRMRDVCADVVSRIASALAAIRGVETCVDPGRPCEAWLRHDRRDDENRSRDGRKGDERSAIGELRHQGRPFALGVAAPFGRVEADMLLGLADAAAERGVKEIRVSPWRALYLPVGDEDTCGALLGAARRLGFVTEADDPVLRIEACPGAPACSSAALDTRAAARAISQLLPRLDGVRRVHVSGCAKGCACSEATDLVLVGGRDRFGIVRNGRADGGAQDYIAPRELGRLPSLIAAGGGGERRE